VERTQWVLLTEVINNKNINTELFDSRNNYVPGPGNYDPTLLTKEKAPNIM
jgi:hypothetical protein